MKKQYRIMARDKEWIEDGWWDLAAGTYFESEKECDDYMKRVFGHPDKDDECEYRYEYREVGEWRSV